MKANKWAQYEREKRQLQDAIQRGKVPAQEYEQRIRRIAAKLGV